MEIRTLEQGFFKKMYGCDMDFIESGFCSGEYNMSFDYRKMLECSEGKALPAFRLYGWKPWTVSLGANQNESDIDSAKCREYGFSIVRRPTGGRAVLHADELTYSCIMQLPQGKSIHDIYMEIHELLLEAFINLGCKSLEFQKAQPDFRNLYSKEIKSLSCFASSARYEINSSGKKLVGSAQRLYGKTMLQHGSILLGKGHELLADVSSLPGDESRFELKNFIISHSITLEEAAGRRIGFDECSRTIKDCIISLEKRDNFIP